MVRILKYIMKKIESIIYIKHKLSPEMEEDTEIINHINNLNI